MPPAQLFGFGTVQGITIFLKVQKLVKMVYAVGLWPVELVKSKG